MSLKVFVNVFVLYTVSSGSETGPEFKDARKRDNGGRE